MKTVSLELAKQLKEAGFPQDSTFFTWIESPSHGIDITTNDTFQKTANGNQEIAAAPTAEEILDRLPFVVKAKGEFYYLSIQIGRRHDYYLKYCSNKYIEGKEYPDLTDNVSSNTLAEAAGKMWLYLKKNNLLK